MGVKQEETIMQLWEEWKLLTFYQKFEKIVSLILSFFIALLILSSLYKLGHHLVSLLLAHGLDPIDYKSFQKAFGMLMIVLIAMEFNHSIVKVVYNQKGIVQVKTVVLIAILAISRKMIILDAKATAPMTLFSLAAILIALGCVYWFIKEEDESS